MYTIDTLLKSKVFLLLLLFLLSIQNTFSQLNPIVDPLYTNPIADAAAIPKFVNQLPIIPRVDYTSGGSTTVYMGVGTHDFGLLPGTPLNAVTWGYNISNTFGYLGPTLVAKKDVPLTIQWVNNLGYSHPLNIDTTLHWAFAGHMGQPSIYDIPTNGVPAVPHVHGGNTESASDGLPEAWWTPLGPNHITGPDYVKDEYYYENNQHAATIWYHDHALGITRQNVYMGLAGYYFIRDDNELGMIANNQLPSGNQEIELAIQDKMFYPDGQLAYPNAPAENMPGFNTWTGGPSAQPEFFGDVIIVNGKAWPYLDVQPRQYRFRIVNGSDSRFYNLSFEGRAQGQLRWTVIGSDQGFLNSPLSLHALLIAPGERYDVVVDFSNPAFKGQTIIIRNDAKTPHPDGDDVNPNTSGLVMAFKVDTAPVNDPVKLPARLMPQTISSQDATNTRKLMLFEAMDQFGRMQPILGIVDPESEYNGTLMWIDPTTENPQQHSTEIWEVYNATVDAHPIHLHLVQFQILGRQKYSATVLPKMNMGHDHSISMGGILTDIDLKGKERKPASYEAGWKDTGIMYPGEVTRIIATFERLGEYVWHCHILSHEDHEMMRKFVVVPALPKANQDPLAVAVADYRLSQNFPNPFNPSTTINFSIPENALVSLKIYNPLGEEVGTLISQEIPKGNHKVEFNASNLNSGMYFYTLSSGSYSQTMKMLLIK